MLKTRYSKISFTLVVAAGVMLARSAPAADDAKAAEDPQRQLISVLQSDAPAADKAITCKRLAVHGTADAVPALAPLLADEQLASWARIALEVIPGPAADEALRQAMGKLKGRPLVGVAVSLGVLVGLVAGFRRGRLDEALMGLTDVVLVIPALPLVIDPVLEYATYLGGNGSDFANSATTDSAMTQCSSRSSGSYTRRTCVFECNMVTSLWDAMRAL